MLTAEEPLASLAKLEVVAFVTGAPLYCSILKPVVPAFFSFSIFLLLACFLFSFYLKQLPCHTIVQWSWVVIQTL